MHVCVRVKEHTRIYVQLSYQWSSDTDVTNDKWSW